MDQSGIIQLFIDWGFSRLKLWLHGGDGRLLYEESIYTSSLAQNSSYYNTQDIEQVKNVLRRALSYCLTASSIEIYSSSQMHALAGTLKKDGDFVSTWNDLPAQSLSGDIVDVSDGIPLLTSMPVYKVIYNSSTRFLSSSHRSLFENKPDEITTLSSPVCLLLASILKLPIPCSRSWWQSTCLSSNELGRIDENPLCYIDESPLELPKSHVHTILGVSVSILIFPEAGDLQASTFSDINECDVLINLGTGSQIILPTQTVCKSLPYYRFYNSRNTAIPTISHIPCGRLLAEYARRRNITFSVLQQAINALTPKELLNICESHKNSLLCFPGFSFHDYAYHQRPKVSANELTELAPIVLMSLWIYQYYRIIIQYTKSDIFAGSNIIIGVVGSLGGFGNPFTSLLVDLLPMRSQFVRRADHPLPHSLLQLHQNGQRQPPGFGAFA